MLGVSIGILIMTIVSFSGLEYRMEEKVQYSHLIDTCITNEHRDHEVKIVDGHYRCFDGNKIVDLDYDYMYNML